MKKVFNLLFMATLVWPTTMQATIPPAKPIKDFKRYAPRSTTRADVNKMGVVTELKYEKLPDMNQARMGHQTFVTNNGLTVAGGHTTGYTLTKTAEIYQNGKWQELKMSSPHDRGFSVELSGGGWMIGGGFSNDNGVGQSRNVDVYNPASGKFQAGPSLSKARTNAKALNINEQLFVSGNWNTEDNRIDYFDGSSFNAVGNMDGRSNPYMMPDKNGNIIVFGTENTYGDAIELYTYNDGSKGLVADYYNTTTGETQYLATIFSEKRFPLSLSDDTRPSDSHFKYNGENFYLILAMEQVSGDDYIYKLFTYCVEDDQYYQYGEFKIPSIHPETGQEISYRGGVIVNEAKMEAYLIGSSAKWLDETVHIISINYILIPIIIFKFLE